METVTVTRGNLTVDVVRAPDADLWDFWGEWSAGRWEPATFDVLDRFLTPAGTYVDLGAWIGPTVLYAARRCRKVLAVEPDPVAFDQLRRNLDLNPAGDVTLVAGAVDCHRDGTVLYSRAGWGNSMSSTVLAVGDRLDVSTWRLADLVHPFRNVDLIKMDIEGAESRVLPDAIGVLAERHIPCLVSLHEDWYGPGGSAAVDGALGEFARVTVLDTPAPFAFRTVLCEWE